MDKKKDMQCCVTQCDRPLDQQFWDTQWQNSQIGWDIGYTAPAIAAYMDQYLNKDAAILIPGCGNAYEAEYLVENDFTNVTLIDIAPEAVRRLKEKFADAPQIKVLCEDFYQHQGKYDLIIEQTFFCTIPPAKRKEYVEKTASLLNKKGKIIGLLFDKTFEQEGPPFGGCPCQYKPVFSPHFDIKVMEECYNSVPPRVGTEVFINLVKKTIEG